MYLEALRHLDEVTRRLRRDCPWDREQDARSIVPHTVEEAYELADAATRDDTEAMVDELGDVLFQVYFLSLLLEERGEGDLVVRFEEAAVDHGDVEAFGGELLRGLERRTDHGAQGKDRQLARL